MNFEIPCDVFARLSNVLRHMPDNANEWLRSIRIENNMAIASNRRILAIEQISGNENGMVHIISDPVLIEQCRKEAPFDSKLYIAVNDMLKFATAKTTMGYIHPGNCAVFSDAPNDLDKWRSKIPLTPAAKAKGAMLWNMEAVADLGASSPSGRLVFEEIVDVNRLLIVRDITDDKWFGGFVPKATSDVYDPAALPRWFK